MSKIALVDDDRNILTSVSMTLEAEGFEVETYNDGQAALDAFNKRMPDMAVLYIKMPRMDGMDLLQRLRQKTAMPVIFLTSKDDEIEEVLGFCEVDVGEIGINKAPTLLKDTDCFERLHLRDHSERHNREHRRDNINGVANGNPQCRSGI